MGFVLCYILKDEGTGKRVACMHGPESTRNTWEESICVRTYICRSETSTFLTTLSSPVYRVRAIYPKLKDLFNSSAKLKDLFNSSVANVRAKGALWRVPYGLVKHPLREECHGPIHGFSEVVRVRVDLRLSLHGAAQLLPKRSAALRCLGRTREQEGDAEEQRERENKR